MAKNKPPTPPNPAAAAKPPAAKPPTDKPAVRSKGKYEKAAKVARDADKFTRDGKRQKAIVDVVCSAVAGQLGNLPDDGGELEQVGVVLDLGKDSKDPVPYQEIVQAFIDQAPFMAEAIRVNDERDSKE